MIIMCKCVCVECTRGGSQELYNLLSPRLYDDNNNNLY